MGSVGHPGLFPVTEAPASTASAAGECQHLLKRGKRYAVRCFQYCCLAAVLTIGQHHSSHVEEGSTHCGNTMKLGTLAVHL